MAACEDRYVCNFDCKDSQCNFPHSTTRVVVIDEEFQCFICHEDVMLSPVSCSDGHTFCKLCIEKWLCLNKTCPVDRGVLSASGLMRNRPLENVTISHIVTL
jgi:hypothetical protein